MFDTGPDYLDRLQETVIPKGKEQPGAPPEAAQQPGRSSVGLGIWDVLIEHILYQKHFLNGGLTTSVHPFE